MPHCEDCGHHHLKACPCGCPKVACPRCKHQHGRKKKDGSCQWCGCEYVAINADGS
ncbi:MAG TPA: hypothetical protein VJL09_03045 [Candidatus Paceibacterota bacterium]